MPFRSLASPSPLIPPTFNPNNALCIAHYEQPMLANRLMTYAPRHELSIAPARSTDAVFLSGAGQEKARKEGEATRPPSFAKTGSGTFDL